MVFSLICNSGFGFSYAIITKCQKNKAVIIDTAMRSWLKVTFKVRIDNNKESLL